MTYRLNQDALGNLLRNFLLFQEGLSVVKCFLNPSLISLFSENVFIQIQLNNFKRRRILGEGCLKLDQ